jgi:diguanylate cyclase (GGDEF)-like protein
MDIQSVVHMTSVICLVSGAVTFAEASAMGETGPTLKLVALAQILVSGTFFLSGFNVKHDPDRFISFGTNLFWIASFTPLILAIRRHHEMPMRLGTVLLVAAFAQVPNILLALVVDQQVLRTLSVGVVGAVYCVVAFCWIARHPARHSIGEWVLMIGLASIVVTTVVRGVLLATHAPPPAPWERPLAIASTAYALAITLFAITSAVAFKMICWHRVNAKLEQVALTDSLTGTLTRRAFHLHFDRTMRMADRSREPLTLFIVDIDRFKQVNDQHGHPVGDVVLTRVAAEVTKALRGTDLLARFGGEEFVGSLPATAMPAALEVAERIRQRVMALVFEEVPGLQVTVSVGVADYRSGGETFESLYQRADTALYRAKEGGRNQVVPARDATQQAAASALPSVQLGQALRGGGALV